MPLAVKGGIGEGGTLQHSNSKIVKDARDLRGQPATPSVMPNDKHQNSQIPPSALGPLWEHFWGLKQRNGAIILLGRISLSSSSILHHFF